MNEPQPPNPDEPRHREHDEAKRLLELALSESKSPSKEAQSAYPQQAELEALFPDLEILDLLGQGGMGTVFRARQKALDRIVALKLLRTNLASDAEFTHRFAREARAHARLQHPNIVHVYEYGEKGGVFYLLLEFVEGVTLRELMNTRSISPAEALEIVPQICSALQYAHNQGVVHRDVKPENILLDAQGRIKVTDFGLAKLAQRDGADLTLTGVDQVMGTLHYMAPEQYKSPGDIDHRVDIFSLGVVFYEMLTGDLPVGKFERPSAASNLDTRLDEIVMKTLERERELRYQQAGEVESDVRAVHALQSASQDDPNRDSAITPEAASPRTATSETSARASRPQSRWATASWISLVVGPFIGGVLGYALYPGGGENRSTFALAESALVVIGASIVAILVGIVALLKTRARDNSFGGERGLWICLGASMLALACGATMLGRANNRIDLIRQSEEREPNTITIPVSGPTHRRRFVVPHSGTPSGAAGDHAVDKNEAANSAMAISGVSFEAPPGVDPVTTGHQMVVTLLWYERMLQKLNTPVRPKFGTYDTSKLSQTVQSLPAKDREQIERMRINFGLAGTNYWPVIPKSAVMAAILVRKDRTSAVVTLGSKISGYIGAVDVDLQLQQNRWVFAKPTTGNGTSNEQR